MKSLGMFYPSLYAAENGCGLSQFQDGKVFDIGFHYLGAMGTQGCHFILYYPGNIHKNLGSEILCCRSFIKQNIPDISSGRQCGLGKMTVILMGIIRKTAEGEYRPDFL